MVIFREVRSENDHSNQMILKKWFFGHRRWA